MPSDPKRVLIVANRTSSTSALLDEVKRRARSGPHRFTLLIPDEHGSTQADWTLETALPLLTRSAGAAVEGLVGGPDPLRAVRRAAQEHRYDEIIISTLAKRSSRWLRRDLPSQLEKLGLPITVITPEADFIASFLPQGDGGTGFGGGPS